MGLSIITTTSASINLAAGPVATELAEGLPGEFADLLANQTLAALLSQVEVSQGGGSDLKTIRRELALEDDSDTNGAAAPTPDPIALVVMLANPVLKSEASLQTPGAAEASALSSALGAGKATGASMGAKTIAEQQIYIPTSLNGTTSAPETGEPQSTIGFAPERAAIIAADRPEPSGETSSFSTIVTAAAPEHGITSPAKSAQTAPDKPAHTETWPQQFSDKIVWMAKSDQLSAQINISPPQLGPVQITLNINGDNASVLFTSPHAEVRQSIENSLPQLREMLAATGISLGQTNVGDNLAQQNQNNAYMMANKNHSTHENAILPANDTVPITASRQAQLQGRGLVDLFA